MAPAAASTELTQRPSFELDVAQAQKASKALLKHMKAANDKADTSKSDKNLLSSPEEEFKKAIIWLVLTTKKHIVDQKKLKPSKILVPHPLYPSDATICLIVADPQRGFKEAIENPAFPDDLRSRITRTIGFSKLKERYKSYESKRLLFSEHDVFLADDRIVGMLPEALGKVFYKTGLKRPIPVEIDGDRPSQAVVDAKRAAAKENKKNVSQAGPASPVKLAAEINRALSSALVHLSPSTCTSVRVGLAGWGAKEVSENIEAVTAGLVERFVPKRWPGVRGIHIKGPDTASLPIYLAEQLWEDQQDILELKNDAPPAIEAGTKKRKSKMDQYAEEVLDEPLAKKSKGKKAKALISGADGDAEAEATVAKLKESSIQETTSEASKASLKEASKDKKTKNA